MPTQTFEATIEADTRGGVRVPIPFDPVAVWGAKPVYHVGGTVGGIPARGVIEGDVRALVLGPAWRRDATEIVGRVVRVTLALEGPQREDLAPDIASALDAHPPAGVFFDSLAQFYRKGYLTWIDATKRSPEKRAERIAEMVRLLSAGIKQR